MVVAETTNDILTGLNHDELGLLQNASEEIALARGQVMAEAGQTASHVYFPLAGVLSLVGTTTGGATVEVAVVGNEGVASLSSVFGSGGHPVPRRNAGAGTRAEDSDGRRGSDARRLRRAA